MESMCGSRSFEELEGRRVIVVLLYKSLPAVVYDGCSGRRSLWTRARVCSERSEDHA